MEVKTKRQNYSLYFLGAYGNTAIKWGSVGEIIRSGWEGEVCIRSTRGMDRDKVGYNVPVENLEQKLREYEAQGIPRSVLTFNEPMPDEFLTIQGEVMRSHEGMRLFYSTVKKPMNEALREKPESAVNFAALLLLKRSLCPSSYDDLMGLLDVFSGDQSKTSVIEFSTYSIDVGRIPNRNTVIWEVRNY